VIESADEIPEKILRDIAGCRKSGHGETVPLEHIIAYSYICETIDIAVSVAGHSAGKPHLERL